MGEAIRKKRKKSIKSVRCFPLRHEHRYKFTAWLCGLWQDLKSRSISDVSD